MDVTPYRETIHDWERTIVPKPEQPLGGEILSFSHVTFSYTEESRTILRDISFSIRRGEMTAIVGKNGSGKSTLCKLVCGFITPNSGKILLNGKDAADKTIYERARTVGYVMQNPNQMLVKDMIRDEIELALKLNHFSEQDIASRVESTLKMTGLYNMRNWPVSALRPVYLGPAIQAPSYLTGISSSIISS